MLFASYKHGGFCMTFKNGWTVSASFAPGTYSSGREETWRGVEAGTVELIAYHNVHTRTVWDKAKGWCSPDEVAAYIAEVAARPSVLKIEAAE